MIGIIDVAVVVVGSPVGWLIARWHCFFDEVSRRYSVLGTVSPLWVCFDFLRKVGWLVNYSGSEKVDAQREEREMRAMHEVEEIGYGWCGTHVALLFSLKSILTLF